MILAAFLIAAPVGVALAFAGLAILPPAMSERLFAAFLALIVLGSLGVLFFAVPRAKKREPASTDVAALASNVVRLDAYMRRAPHRTRVVGRGSASIAPLRRAKT